MPHGTRLSIGLSVNNLFNQDTVISKFITENESAALAINEADLYAGRLDFEQVMADQHILKDARFLMADGFQAPRTARVLVAFSF